MLLNHRIYFFYYKINFDKLYALPQLSTSLSYHIARTFQSSYHRSVFWCRTSGKFDFCNAFSFFLPYPIIRTSRDFDHFQAHLFLFCYFFQGTCGDGYHCSGNHTFDKCKLDYNALSRMTLSLKNMQDQIQNELSLHSYTAQLSK